MKCYTEHDENYLIIVSQIHDKHGKFNIYFSEYKQARNMIDSVGWENIIAAIEFESNIGL